MTHRFDDPIRQQICDTVRALNGAWTQGNPDDLAGFLHRDMVAITATERHRLNGSAACIAAWKGFAKATRTHRWEEIDPVIHVYGNTAVVAYDFDMSFDQDGRTIDVDGRDMFFFIEEDGRWWAAAD